MALQFLVMPFIGYTAVLIFANVQDVEKALLLVITSSPGGVYSNFFASLFNADLALSVAMTSASTVGACVMLPFNLWVYLGNAVVLPSVQLDWGALGISVAIVILGVLTGLFLNTKYPHYAYIMQTVGNLGGLALLVLGWVRSGEGSSTVWYRPPASFLICAYPSLLALLVTQVVIHLGDPHLAKPKKVAVTLEVMYQNTGIAIAVGFASFSGEDEATALLIPGLYAFYGFIIVPIYLIIMWKLGWTYADPNENCWKMITTNYQPNHEVLPIYEHAKDFEYRISRKSLKLDNAPR